MANTLQKVLVANRGEIAIRVMRTAREMGMKTVPGYGFLSENAAFVDACDEAGLTFVGPPASAMRAMGSKTAAREVMGAAGVPIVPGAYATTVDEATAAAERIGYPIMLKAASGGGGKGMRLVHEASEMANAWERARSEAKKFFGDDTVYLEKAILSPRHVEIQVMGDRHGNVVHVFERDCSIQRRNQKVVEETPSPAASHELIERMGAIAVKGAKAVGYYSAGTFEFLLAPDGNFYFLEMNTRLQVEHPVTELITGLDLVRAMFDVAAGKPLPFTQEQVVRRGAAIQCRIYAEDPSTGYLPSPGTIQELRTPSGPGVRDDSGAYAGCTISSFYDPLISKLCVWAPTREEAVQRMRRALAEYVVTGIKTNLAFHERLFQHPKFVAGEYDTGFLDREKASVLAPAAFASEDEEAVAIALAVDKARADRKAKAPVEGASGKGSGWVSEHRARLWRS
jgi:acetyl-CoA carboxylase biotin carboxylase subunit